MTRFLASVTGRPEAHIALDAGADIIDFKNPSDGALGALPVELVQQTVSWIDGRAETSAVCGNLPMEPVTVRETAERVAGAGVDYVKIGFPAEPDRIACVRALAPLARRVKLVALMFADAGPDFSLLPLFAENGFAGVMLDTAGKGQGGLLSHLSPERLRQFVGDAQALGLMSGLSGSLQADDVPRLVPLGPDFLGFRGALCGTAGRAGTIDREAVARIRERIPREPVEGPTKGSGRAASRCGMLSASRQDLRP